MSLDVHRYVKRPIPIEAVEVTPDNLREVAEWCLGEADETGVFITTLEGRMYGPIGSYVACGPFGEFYPIQGDVFDETYERAD